MPRKIVLVVPVLLALLMNSGFAFPADSAAASANHFSSTSASFLSQEPELPASNVDDNGSGSSLSFEGTDVGEFANPELNAMDAVDLEIHTMDDLVAILGADHVDRSANRITLKEDIFLTQHEFYYIPFVEGTYVIDFNNFHINIKGEFVNAGADITLLDSSPSHSGGLTSQDGVDPDGKPIYNCSILHFAGNLTILSGVYEGGSGGLGCLSSDGKTVTIEGGEFRVLSGDKSDGAVIVCGNVLIKDGIFEGPETGLLVKKSGTLNLQISGGLFSCVGTNSTFGGIAYSECSGTVPDIQKLIAKGSKLLPATTRPWSIDNTPAAFQYITTEKNVMVVGNAGVGGFVNRLYSKALGREPDFTGYLNWVTQLESKKITGDSAAYGFFFSDELINRNLTNSDFITLLYRVFFDRTPDPDGMKYWLASFDSGVSRKYIFAGFANSQEWKTLCAGFGIDAGSYTSDEARDQNPKVTVFVQRLYKLCLNRSVDIQGLNYWADALNTKTKDGATVAYGFFFSNEFMNRKLSNGDYVEVLYKVLLGRDSDAAGKTDWVSKLNAGTDRLKIFQGFVYSQEFEKICADAGITRGSI